MIQYAILAMIRAIAFQRADRSQLLVPKFGIVVVVSFALFAFTQVHPALIIFGAGVLGAVLC